MARPDLYNLLYRQIPPERIHHGKKVLNCWQSEEGVTIRTWDKKFYHGDILVGADGAYSDVRQRLFESLREKGTLAPSDDVPLPFECVCLVGQTDVLDPEEFPALHESFSQGQTVLGISQPANVRTRHLSLYYSTMVLFHTKLISLKPFY